MSVTPGPSLEAQRQELRIRLQAQRRVISAQLQSESGAPRGFPRSMSMRLLTRRPQLISKVVGGLFGLLRSR